VNGTHAGVQSGTVVVGTVVDGASVVAVVVVFCVAVVDVVVDVGAALELPHAVATTTSPINTRCIHTKLRARNRTKEFPHQIDEVVLHFATVTGAC
jgi:hypothetical protein